MSKKINAPLGTLESKAKAVEAGVQFAREIGIQDFIMEGDSLIVFNALCGNTSPPSSVAVVVSSIQVLSGYLNHVEFSHAIGIVDFIAWVEENPCFIEQSLHYDVSLLN